MIEKKTVLITGANGGIGRALIKKYAEAGYCVIANMREEKQDFFAFKTEISEQYQTELQCVYFDVTKEDEIKQYTRLLLKEKIKIDVLVNNAGVAHGGFFQMTPISVVKNIFDVNYFGTVMMSQYISRLMERNGGGSIVNLASAAGMDLDEGNVAYGASKAAVIAFTKSVAKELAPKNIRMNAIAPGLTDTKMAEQMEQKAGEEMIRQTAMKRLARPEEIANAVYFIGSEQASFITGQVLRVDGGM